MLGYLHKQSYFPNEKIKLQIHSKEKMIQILIYDFKKDKYIQKYSTNGSLNQLNSVGLLFVEGYKWKVNHILQTPPDIEHGLYFIELSNNKSKYYIPFVIKSEKKHDFVVLMNTNTWYAYDSTGGASFYRYNMKYDSKYGKVGKKKPIKPTVTYDRPLNFISNNIKFYLENKITDKYDHLLYGECRLLRWLIDNNYDICLISDLDIDNNYNLKKHKNLVLNCHPEYWTQNMIININNNAPNIISFSANVGYRKLIRNDLVIECIGLWDKSYLVNVTGSYYDDRGFDTNASYKIINKEHFLLNGITGNFIGEKTLNKNKNNDQGTSGYETDKIIIDKKYLIARGLNSNSGGGDIIYCEIDNRKIFSMGSICSTGGLYIDKNTEVLFKNVLDHFKK